MDADFVQSVTFTNPRQGEKFWGWTAWPIPAKVLPISRLPALFLVKLDQGVGGAIVLAARRPLQLTDDSLGKYLAQLDSPLVEGINLPDGALGEDTVLIERN